MKKGILLVALGGMLALFGGCAWTVPDTLGDPKNAPSYGYTPLDPLPVDIKFEDSQQPPPSNQELLDLMPDETMRLGIGKVESSGAITYGPVSVGTAGSSYLVVLDYTKCTTSQIPLKKTKTEEGTEYSRVADNTQPDIVLPVYVGVGLRLTASVTVTEGQVDLVNLLAVGAAVKGKRASGTLVVQTLGLTGEGVSTAIPIPSELNETTIQNALMAMGTVKAKTYDPKTLVTPRVLGVYNSVGGGQETVNGLVSALLEDPVFITVPASKASNSSDAPGVAGGASGVR